MSDGYIRIDTKVDEKGLDKGLKSVDSKLKSTEKTTNSTAKSLGGLALKAGAAAAAIKIATAVVGDLTAAFKKQEKAETQLESAARNNPYLDATSVQKLKNYASELQSFSTFGDEELLPMMAKLAAAGRTQDEIMSVMSAAVDMAASGAFTLESAVTNLNKSYGGLSGELGETIPEIKALTSEQLKNGAAVKLLAGRYSGIAKEVAQTTGTAEQLANAFGDLKEELGAPFEKGLGPVRTFFTALVSGWASSAKAKREAEESMEKKDPVSQLKAQEYALEQINKEYRNTVRLAENEKSQYGVVSQEITDQIDILVKKRQELTGLVVGLQEQVRVEKALADATKKGNTEEAKRLENQKNAADYIAENTAAREKALLQLELQAATEERSVTAAEKLAVYAQSYVDLVGNSNGLVTSTNRAAISLLNTTKEIADEAEKQNQLKEDALELEKNIAAILGDINAADNRKESERMQERLDLLDNYYANVLSNEQVSADNKTAIDQEYAEKREILAKQITDMEKAENDAQVQAHRDRNAKIAETASQFAAQYANIMSAISELATKAIEDEAAVKTAKLQEQYESGAISAEEYNKKLQEIEKESAEEKYKIDMWVWSANLLSAVANTAVGATQALAQGGIIGPILAAMITAAGGLQLAAIIASKPIPPAFATGGIVGGASYYGDKIITRQNSGEMNLNMRQQRNLFDRINGNQLGASGANVQVYNSAANDVSAKPVITEDGIKIMIRKTVSKDMSDGRFNTSFRTMQNGMKGVRYTN